MLATIRKWLVITLLLVLVGFLLYRGFQWRQARDELPEGSVIAGLDVSALTLTEAADKVTEAYQAPVYLYHRDEHVELDPHSVGFAIDAEAMMSRAQQQTDSREDWVSFVAFALERPVQPVKVPLMATHDEAGLRAMLQSVAGFLDQPATAPQILTRDDEVKEGQEGFVTDIEASIVDTQAALYRPHNRDARLTLVDEQPPEMSLELLTEVINSKLQGFEGLGSVFVMDLESGEEIGINEDVVVSGLSILKIAIFVEAFRAMDGPPNAYQQQLLLDTATRSSNFGANLLLHEVAGESNTYKGADILTESMRKLGLVNTFMAVPYDATPPAYRRTTYVTPANSTGELLTQPDPTMQSTAEEIGSLLAMIYYCAQGGGPLLAIYPEELTPDECQAIIDLMVLNEEGNLIRYGVPEGTAVSHKHGWARATHADAGIVFSPGGDFVIVEYLDQPGDWLLADVSFPILREIARAAYNYFNMDEPYFGNPLAEAELIDPNNPFSEIREPQEAEGAEEQAEDESGTGAANENESGAGPSPTTESG
ncbi:MAG: serine hydrolase [Chloroflexota bacterium]|nr:MAG: serine hydrolase [Chloroflexota bacterium]